MRTAARGAWVLAAGVASAVACGYPDYDFVDVTGTGGSAGTASPLGGAGSGGTSAGTGGTGGSAGSTGISGGGSGGVSGGGGTIITGSGGAEGGAGGAVGEGGASGDNGECAEDGEGGAGGAAPYTCADYSFVPAGCTCHDHDNHAYFFCESYRNFDNASIYCGYDGMQLARVDTSEENGWIRTTATARVPPLEYYWLGGTSEGTPDSWRWVDGTPFWQGHSPGEPICSRFANWRGDSPSDPANTEPDQTCLYFTMDGWDDDGCLGNRMYVCEYY